MPHSELIWNSVWVPALVAAALLLVGAVALRAPLRRARRESGGRTFGVAVFATGCFILACGFAVLAGFKIYTG